MAVSGLSQYQQRIKCPANFLTLVDCVTKEEAEGPGFIRTVPPHSALDNLRHSQNYFVRMAFPWLN